MASEGDKGPRVDTFTRGEVLRLRGYPEEIIAGRRGAPAPSSSSSRPSRCVVCDAELDEARRRVGAKTCARPDCVTAARRRRDRAVTASRNGHTAAEVRPIGLNEPAAAPEPAAPALNHGPAPKAVEGRREPSKPKRPARPDGPSSRRVAASALEGRTEAANLPEPGRDRLGPLYRALMLAGASVTRLELEVAGECWTVTRTTTNGGTRP